MHATLIINSGPHKGKRFKISKPGTIGRHVDATIRINDSKISNIHAKIRINKQNEFIIKDNDSRNGIFLGSKQVSSFRLKKGREFSIGPHKFYVADVVYTKNESTATKEVLDPDLSEAINRAENIEPAEGVRPLPWREELVDLFENQILKNIENVEKELYPFNPPLELEIVTGVQVETIWTLGYGPRSIGFKSLDFPLINDQAPDTCFTLTQKDDQVFFETQHPDQVLLNSYSYNKKAIEHLDEVTIFDTTIVIKKLKDLP